VAFFQAEGISVTFGGVRALSGLSFDVEQGEVFAIVGPNGAGKTTALNCISRFYDVAAGRLSFKGTDITRARPHAVADLGIARTFQNIELFKNTTVIQNVLLGRHRHRRSTLLSEVFFVPSVRRQEVESRTKAEEVIDFLDLQPYRDHVVGSLPYGVQKTVELARALAMGPELLLLDEPSSGLNPEEAEELAFWIDDIKKDLGITVVLIEHNMGLVKSASDRVLALDFGQVIAQGTPDEVLGHPDVVAAYLGEQGDLA
jgi:branched-chain amino acid transport system ATP-binding protein